MSIFATRLKICSVHNCHKLRGAGAGPQSFVQNRHFLGFTGLRKEWCDVLGLKEENLKRSCPVVCFDHFRIEDIRRTKQQYRVIPGRGPVNVINGERGEECFVRSATYVISLTERLLSVKCDYTMPNGLTKSIVETDPDSPFVDRRQDDEDDDDLWGASNVCQSRKTLKSGYLSLLTIRSFSALDGLGLSVGGLFRFGLGSSVRAIDSLSVTAYSDCLSFNEEARKCSRRAQSSHARCRFSKQVSRERENENTKVWVIYYLFQTFQHYFEQINLRFRFSQFAKFFGVYSVLYTFLFCLFLGLSETGNSFCVRKTRPKTREDRILPGGLTLVVVRRGLEFILQIVASDDIEGNPTDVMDEERANLYHLQQTCPILILSTLTLIVRNRHFLGFTGLRKEWCDVLGLKEENLKRSCPVVCFDHFRIEDIRRTKQQYRVIPGRGPVNVINGERVKCDYTPPNGLTKSIVETDPDSPFVDRRQDDEDDDDLWGASNVCQSRKTLKSGYLSLLTIRSFSALDGLGLSVGGLFRFGLGSSVRAIDSLSCAPVKSLQGTQIISSDYKLSTAQIV
eukprot:sb/3463488/